MDNRIRFLPAILAFITLSLPGVLFAATGHVKFWVAGQSSCTKETASGATTLAIGQQCPTGAPIITISTASLDMDGTNTSDTSLDAWRMPYTVSITANQAVSNLHLIFLREAAQGPTAAYYKTWVKGGISNGSGTITVTGSVKEMTSGDILTLDPVTVSAANGNSFQSSSVKQWTPGTLTGNRELQVDLNIVSLTQGAILNLALGGGGYIKLRSQASPDRPDPCEVSSQWLMTTACLFDRPVLEKLDAAVEQHADAYKFAQFNWENLLQDMARGQGEHLVSLATLLNVALEQQPAFFEMAQGAYRTSTGVETPKQLVSSLHETWNSR
jgi:Protein of unknown function (DUF3015)